MLLGLGGALAGVALAVAAWASSADPAVRRHARLGAAVNVLVLVFMGVAALGGVRARWARADAEAQVRRASASAPQDFPGWYGEVVVDGARVFALEIDRRSDLGQMIASNFQGSFSLLVIGLNNRDGRGADLEVDLADLTLELADGRAVRALDRMAVLASAKSSREEVLQRHGAPYRVPPGASMGNGLAFVPDHVPMEKVVALSLAIDGKPARLRGGYLSVAEKRRRQQPAP